MTNRLPVLVRAAAAVVAVASVAASLAACVVLPPAAAAPATALSWAPCPPLPEEQGPVPPGVTAPPGGRAGPQPECATLTVPLDHADPGGRTVDLVAGRLRATDPAARRGVLVLSPGGPGAALRSVVHPVHREMLTDLRRWYDVVTVDPRGYGLSAPLCDPGLAPVLDVWGDPADPVAAAGRTAATAAYAQACHDADPALAVRAGTAEHAQDVDALRVALGEDRIVFLGNSYGTAVGFEYAARFGEHLDRLVLDSVLDLHAPWEQEVRETARVREAGLQRWAADCTADPGCALHDDDPLAVWDGVVAAAEEAPLPAGEHPPVTAQQLRTLSAVLGAPGYGQFGAQALVAARDGDASAFAALLAGPVQSGDVGRIAECPERDLPPPFAEQLALAGSLRAEVPRVGWLMPFGAGFRCDGWTYRTAGRTADAVGAGVVPALLVNATLDTATHLAGARRVAERLPGAALLTVDGYAHSHYLASGNPCVRDAVHRYLADGTLPAPGAECAV